jgi:SSS family solute:Na+ symporter
MTIWIIVFSALWLTALAYFSFSSFKKTHTANDYIFAGSNLGVILGLLTFAATLFSTFTFMGMPDFFRTHGIGAWIFLAISDGAMFFFILWFGHNLRRKAIEKGYKGIAGLLNSSYNLRYAGYAYFAGVFIFLIPYVAIQIRGISIFFSAIFPDALPAWGWATAIVIVMLIYSELGGLRAIIYSDALQAVILLVTLWVIAVVCIKSVGGVSAMFAKVRISNEALLSVPGPKGLFTVQFLIASFFAIVMLPVTQPQITTRLIIMKDHKKMRQMAVAMGIFTFFILLATVFIGMYGEIKYGGASTREFLANVLLFEQLDIIAALVVIGLLAAAISTSDSQIFALGTELRSLLHGDERKVMFATRGAILVFGFSALIFSLVSGDELVLLARVSFAGTSILAPLILNGIFSSQRAGKEVIIATTFGLVVFLASLFNFIPSQLAGIRIDLIIIGSLAIFTIISAMLRHKS